MIEIYIFLIHFICYWSMVYEYDKSVPPQIFWKSAKNSLKNQILYTLPSIYLLVNYYPIKYDNILLSFGYIPFLVVAGDCYFYITHRPLHTKILFNLHKSHHNGIVHVAKSLDADGIEHIVGNLGSFIIGILLFQYFGYIINIYVLEFWVGFSTINTCISHSNKNCLLDDGNHQTHHKYLKCNYGTGLYILDRCFGSYK